MALGLALPVANIQAQEEGAPGRGPRGDRQGGPAFIAALDANRDGKLDKSEISASTEALKKLDKDSDGKLTLQEVRGGPGRGPRGEGEGPARPEGDRPNRERSEENAGPRPGLPPLVAALDANKNGSIETDELTGAPAALLKLDKDGDGELSGDELRAGRGPRTGGPRGEGRGPGRPESAPQK